MFCCTPVTNQLTHRCSPFLLLYAYQTPDQLLRMYNSLYVLRKVFKRFEYARTHTQQGPDIKRATLDHMIQLVFPYLQALLPFLVENNALEAAQILTVCLKIFHTCTMSELPSVSGVDVGLWFRVFGTILDKKLPEASEGVEPLGQPVDIEAREAWGWWKLKKWSAKIVVMFLRSYGNPENTGEKNKAFAEYFRANLATQLLGPVMNTLAVRAGGGFVTDKVLHKCFEYDTLYSYQCHSLCSR